MSSKSPDSETYPRHDWWGDPEVETIADQHREHGTEWSQDVMHNEKARHTARHILRGVAPALCSVSTVDPAKAPTELSEPYAYPHGQGNREHLRACRVNPEEGYLSGGESTGVALGDLPSDQFFDVIEILIATWQAVAGVTEQGAATLMRDARRMKQEPSISDEEAITRLVEDVLSPGPVGADDSD